MHPSLLATLATITAIGILLAALVFLYRRYQRQRRHNFIRTYAFPKSIATKLAMKHGALDRPDIDLTLSALRQYFLVCADTNAAHRSTSMGMPSRVVDDAWHEFILISRAYGAFCTKAFGTYLHHAPEGTTRTGTSTALANTLGALSAARWARESWAIVDGIPLLFGIDRALKIEGGFVYTHADLAALDQLCKRRAAQGSAHAGGGGGCSSAHSGWDLGGGDGGAGGCGGGGCSS